MLTYRAALDEVVIERMMNVRMSAFFAAQLTTHVIKLISSHLGGDKAPVKRSLQRLDATWQMRMKILGEIAYPNDGISTVRNVTITELVMTAVTLENDVDIVKQDIVHDMNSTDLLNICPDNLLDYLFVFLESIIKSILPKVPNELRYATWSQECLTEARELISNLRCATLLIDNLPERDSGTSISDMFFHYIYLPVSPDTEG